MICFDVEKKINLLVYRRFFFYIRFFSFPSILLEKRKKETAREREREKKRRTKNRHILLSFLSFLFASIFWIVHFASRSFIVNIVDDDDTLRDHHHLHSQQQIFDHRERCSFQIQVSFSYHIEIDCGWAWINLIWCVRFPFRSLWIYRDLSASIIRLHSLQSISVDNRIHSSASKGS